MSIYRHITIKLVALFAAFAFLVASASGAFGATNYQGSDRSFSVNNNHNVTVCDMEADGRTAYAQLYSFAGNYDRVNDLSGSNGCPGGGYTSGYKPSGISSHITCENINNWPDACSDYWSVH